MTETQQRFLRSIAERVPLEHVVELHLFPPIRQGGVETGVAVVAEDPRRSAGDADLAPAETDTRASDDPVAEILTADADSEVLTDESAETSELVPTADTVVEQADGSPGAESNGDANGSHTHAARYTIHTARYRLTLKGVDRGKWEVDVVAEADAPLEALDAVVRGVQRRAGEGAEPDRLSTDALRDVLELTPAQLDR